jgi:hypothetical protein
MRRLAAAVRSAATALIGLLVDDPFVIAGTASALALTWMLWRTGWMPASALGFVLFVLVVATLAASLRHAARTERSRTSRPTA